MKKAARRVLKGLTFANFSNISREEAEEYLKEQMDKQDLDTRADYTPRLSPQAEEAKDLDLAIKLYEEEHKYDNEGIVDEGHGKVSYTLPDVEVKAEGPKSYMGIPYSVSYSPLYQQMLADRNQAGLDMYNGLVLVALFPYMDALNLGRWATLGLSKLGAGLALAKGLGWGVNAALAGYFGYLAGKDFNYMYHHPEVLNDPYAQLQLGGDVLMAVAPFGSAVRIAKGFPTAWRYGRRYYFSPALRSLQKGTRALDPAKLSTETRALDLAESSTEPVAKFTKTSDKGQVLQVTNAGQSAQTAGAVSRDAAIQLFHDALGTDRANTLLQSDRAQEYTELLSRCMSNMSKKNFDDLVQSMGEPKARRLMARYFNKVVELAVKGNAKAIELLRNQSIMKEPMDGSSLKMYILERRDKINNGTWTELDELKFARRIYLGAGDFYELNNPNFTSELYEIMQALKEHPGSFFYETDLSTNSYTHVLNLMIREWDIPHKITVGKMDILNDIGSDLRKYPRPNGKYQVRRYDPNSPNRETTPGESLTKEEIVEYINKKIDIINQKTGNNFPHATLNDKGKIIAPYFHIQFKHGGKLIKKMFNIIH